eukprot:TRINITY_DN69516_c0_g1_i1.p1 TRINITY_DN69516_c0_g1~~TRINITY_DN69516_c0_g1_i1.p1  ORF type:complete len:529 (-),score=127.45 TRINITY_DN69516_c0_g1_i1:41-1627(-)
MAEVGDAPVGSYGDTLVQYDTSSTLEEYLSDKYLAEICGTSDFTSVRRVEMIVDTQENSLGSLGKKLPHLDHLKLNNSRIWSIRDLGSSLSNLKVLWMDACGLEELDGISSMPSLKELHAASNKLSDVSPLSSLENLIILDLKENDIDDLESISFLAPIVGLRSLTLTGNPISKDPGYRSFIRLSLPNVEYLDDAPIFSTSKSPLRRKDEFVTPITHDAVENDESIHTPQKSHFASRRPMSARPTRLRGTESGGSLGVASPSFAMGKQPLWSSQIIEKSSPSAMLSSPLPAGGERSSSSFGLRGSPPSSAKPSDRRRKKASWEDWSDGDDGSSELTYGGGDVFCGNPAQRLRQRRMKKPHGLSDDLSPKSDDSILKEQHASLSSSSIDDPIWGVVEEEVRSQMIRKPSESFEPPKPPDFEDLQDSRMSTSPQRSDIEDVDALSLAEFRRNERMESSAAARIVRKKMYSPPCAIPSKKPLFSSYDEDSATDKYDTMPMKSKLPALGDVVVGRLRPRASASIRRSREDLP